MVIANFENITKVEHTRDAFIQAFRDNLYYTRGQAIYTATQHDLYTALAHTVRDYMMLQLAAKRRLLFPPKSQVRLLPLRRIPGWDSNWKRICSTPIHTNSPSTPCSSTASTSMI